MAEALMTGRTTSTASWQGLIVSTPVMAATSRPANLAVGNEVSGSYRCSKRSNQGKVDVLCRGTSPPEFSRNCSGKMCVAGCHGRFFGASSSAAGSRNHCSLKKGVEVSRTENRRVRRLDLVRCRGASEFYGPVAGNSRDGFREKRFSARGDCDTSLASAGRERRSAGVAVGRLKVRVGRKRDGKVMASWLWGQDAADEEVEEVEAVEDVNGEVAGLSSIGDFTRFMDNGDDGAELQTAIVSYRKPFPWNLFSKQQVDLVAAVHIADKRFFGNLQDELESYDRVLYEMVADKNPKLTNRNAKFRWRPPKRRGRSGFSIIGTIQKLMARILTLDFQLECMDYRRDNWFHADLDYETFQKLQDERGETFFTFAKDLTEISTKTVLKNLTVSEDMEPWRSKLLWVARVFPMPLLGLVVIESVCAPSDSPLNKSPEMKALLELDLPSAMKVYLAKQLTTDLTQGASSLVEKSVIIGERNRVAMEELQQALQEGCKKIAIFYGSGHLPDMDARLRKDFGLEPREIQWRTAWSIQSRKTIRQGALTNILGSMARVSGWPLNRYQTLALLFLSGVLAVDLWFWELFLGAINDYAQQTIVVVVNLLERGWDL